MERFGYPSLSALYEESSEILLLMEAESYGYKRDQKEELEEQERAAEEARNNGQ